MNAFVMPRSRLGSNLFLALAIVFVFAFAFAAPAAAQSTPPCSQLVAGTRFTLPAMTSGQVAVVPAVVGASAVCIEGMQDAESVGLKMSGESPYTAVGNNTPLTVDAENAASMVLSDPSFNGSVLKASPLLPTVKVEALTDVSDGITVWVGNPRPTVIAAVVVDQWVDVRIPGSLGELRAGTTKWSGNGVTVKVTSGAAFTVNGAAVLPEPGKTASVDFYVDGVAELELVGTVNGQRFYMNVDADAVTAASWLQKRVDPTTATTTGAASTAGAQYVNLGGACFSAATCSASQAVACVAGAPKLPCTPGDSLSVWGAPAPMTFWHALQIVK